MSTKRKKTTKSRAKEITIQSPLDPNLQIVVASEMADDEMIEREMMGEVLPFFVYKFTQDGKDVVGLTVKGVNEVVRRLNKNPRSGSKIRINPQYLIKEEKEYDGEKGIEVSVYAEDLITGNTAWGVKFEPYRKMGRNGVYKNAFAVEKALSKAERNAKRKLIAEPIAIKIIEKLIKEEPNTVKTLEPTKTQVITVRPPKPQPSTPEELANIAIEAIKGAKTIDVVMRIDDGAQRSEKLSFEQKNVVHAEAIGRMEELKKEL